MGSSSSSRTSGTDRMGLIRREGRHMKGKRIVMIAALAAGMLASTTSAQASATVPQKCASSKQKAVAKKEASKLGCYSKAAGKAVQVDQTCLMKADTGFTTAFTKADAKGVCEGTASAVEFTVDHCIDQLNAVLTGTGKCPGAKLKAAGKNGSAKAGCWAKATAKGVPTGGSNPDPAFVACLQKADTGLKNAFTKADGSTPCAGTEAGAASIVDPGETCDDGNTVDGDACPANCVIQSCTVNTGTHQGVSLHLTTPAGVTVGGLTLLLDYPEGHVRMPATTPGTNVLDTPNDLTYELKDALIDSTGTDGIPANGAGPILQVMFDGCQGQALPVVTDYTCTIIDAADENGTSIDLSTLSCAVTIP